METIKWIEEYFKNNWKEIETDIDFSKYEPIKSSSFLHVNEDVYEIEGKTYRLLYGNEIDSKPLIEELI